MEETLRKNEILQSFSDISLLPSEVKLVAESDATITIPFDDLIVMGGSFAAVAASLKSIVADTPYKLYQAFDAEGKPMKELPYRFNDRPGYSNLYHDALGNSHAADMREVKLPSNTMPSAAVITIAAAVVIRDIEKKLDTIQETQQTILNFLQDDKRASLKANIDFLLDILNNFKHNWDNEMYKTNMHMKVLDIRQSAEQNIEFYRRQIVKHFEKKKLIITDKTAKEILSKTQSDMEDYKTAMNLYGFASFVEVLLLGNFSEDYLGNISERLKKTSLDYRELYSEVYERINSYLTSSANSLAIKGIASVSKFAGETIAKIPVISKGQLDENLIEAHEKLNDWNSDRPEQILKRFTAYRDTSANTFAENIDSINALYNRPTELFFDDNNAYLVSA